MALTKMSTPVHNIQDLSDLPNVTDGLTSSQLKERFDKAGVDIKDYLNATLTEELDTKLNSLETQANSIASVVAFIQETMLSYLDIYPVGSIYISVNSTNPGTIFGGTWTRIKDRFLLASGDTYANGSTGGEATHKLTTTEIPAHTHGSKSLTGKLQFRPMSGGVNNIVAGYGSSGITNVSLATGDSWANSITSTPQTRKTDVVTVDATHEHTSVGGNGYHNNMPPYLTVYVWKRTA